MNKIPFFARFSRFFSAALFAAAFVFGVPNAYSDTDYSDICGVGVSARLENGTLYCGLCKEGYEQPESIVFPKEQAKCRKTGNYANSTGRDWLVTISGNTIHGTSYCSSTPRPSFGNGITQVKDEVCDDFLHPTSESIDTAENSGQYCWCKATSYETPSGTQQELDTRYVYAVNVENVNACSTDCPHICRSIQTNTYSSVDTVRLRISIYRSLKNQCVPVAGTITLKDGNNTFDTISNYTAESTVLLPTPSPKNGFEFVGWCEDLSNCDNPMTGAVTGLSGNKTLHAKWVAIQTSDPSTGGYSASCGTGYKSQTNVFASEQYCAGQDGHGYAHTGGSYTSSPISGGDGTWTSYFSTFRVKGRAYCSKTAPGVAVTGSNCPTIPRRPMAETINTNNSGTQCWCQATEHQQISTISNTWTAPYQKIYAKYVYLKDMGNSCLDSCAAYCSYMNTGLILDGSVDNRVNAENLRASIYDSLLDCIPIENKITYKSDDEIIDYQYFTNSVTLRDAPVKPNFEFKGWCEDSEICNNPIAAGSVKTNWSGAKTLYAKWELAKCDEGVKTQYVNGTLTCTDECEDGYEQQFDPFSPKYGYNNNVDEVSYCTYTGNGSGVDSNQNWFAIFGSTYKVSGTWHCSTTEPDLASTSIRDGKCRNAVLRPMRDEISTQNNGNYCWCHATQYEQLYNNNYITKQTIPLNSKYVYALELNSCSNSCANTCASIYTNTVYNQNIGEPSLSTQDLRVSIYRSLKKCVKQTSSITYINGDTTYGTVPNYTVTTSVTLPELSNDTNPGFTFVGWCEDLSDCEEPMTGQQTGLSGNKTLYAKWVATPSNITYQVNKGILPNNAPMTYTIDTVTQLQPVESSEYVFEGWYDNAQFNGDPIESLPTSTHQTGSVTLYAKQTRISSSPTAPVDCGIGYEDNNSSIKTLDPTLTGIAEAYRTHDNNTTLTNGALPEIVEGNASTGRWGVYFGTQDTTIYGTSSCNYYTGDKPDYGMVYTTKDVSAIPISSNDLSMAGGNCWCKATKFKRDNISTPLSSDDILETPWVYVNTFSSKGGNNATKVCESECAILCAETISNEQFFRTQLFGDYSMCKIKSYSISYFDGTTQISAESLGLPTEYTVKYHDIDLPTSLPESIQKSHYSFGTWVNENNVAITKIIAADGGNRSIYTKWQPDEFHINFDPTTSSSGMNGFSGTVPSQTVHYDDTNISLNTNAFSIDGYTFKDWSCSATRANGETYTGTYPNGGKISKYEYVDDMTCSANWDTIEYSITYDSSAVDLDSGWLATQPNSFTIINTDINIPTPTPTNNQYTFKGWCVGAMNTCTDDQLQANYTIFSGTTGNVVLSAYWDVATYTIKYYNGETQIENLEPDYYFYGQETLLPISLDSSLKPHYNFIGWKNADNNEIAVISDTDYGNKEFWAQWEPIEYTIKYYSDSSKDTLFKEVTYTVETPSITDLPVPAKSYFRFDGWKNENDESIDSINTLTGGDREFYATWVRTSCEEDYYLENETCLKCPDDYPYSNGNSKSSCYAICPETSPLCPEHSATCTYDEYVGEGYKNYYHEGISPCGVVYECESHYTDFGTTCEPDTYTITYYDDTTPITDLGEEYYTYTFGQGLVLPNAQKDHYDFVNWSNNNGDTIGIISQTDYGDKIFWANWAPEEFRIDFAPGTAGDRTTGFVGEVRSQQVSFNANNIKLNKNNYEITGYRFTGWSCNAKRPDGSLTTVSFGDEAIIEQYNYIGVMACTAQWTPQSYTLYYSCADGQLADGQPASTIVYYDSSYVLKEKVCETRQNYTLLSWDCTNNLDTSYSKWNITDNAVCTAVWGDKRYTITYKEKDGSVITDMLPKTYIAAGTTIVPTDNPTREHFEFIGWCDNENLTGDCPKKRTIQPGSNADMVFYAKWAAFECPAGQYLDSTVCRDCPKGTFDYTSDAWIATKQSDCYFDWQCDDTCPEGADCEPEMGAYRGRIYYGEDEYYSCKINMDCHRGYSYIEQPGYQTCMLNKYTVNYHGVNYNKSFYTVKDGGFSVVPPTRDGYTFNGWCKNTETCEDPTIYFVVNTETTLENLDLYAQWIEDVEPMPEEFSCDSGRWLHIGDATVCLSTTKPSSKPLLGLRKDRTNYYLQMTKQAEGSDGLPVNENSNIKWKVLYNDEGIYNVHDASVGNTQ